MVGLTTFLPIALIPLIPSFLLFKIMLRFNVQVSNKPFITRRLSFPSQSRSHLLPLNPGCTTCFSGKASTAWNQQPSLSFTLSFLLGTGG